MGPEEDDDDPGIDVDNIMMHDIREDGYVNPRPSRYQVRRDVVE